MYRMQQQEASTTEPMNMVSSKPLPVEEHSLTYNVENDDAHIDEEQRPYFSEARRQQENHGEWVHLPSSSADPAVMSNESRTTMSAVEDENQNPNGLPSVLLFWVPPGVCHDVLKSD